VGELERYKVSEGHFRDWLHRGLTGCSFAGLLAAKRPVRIDFYSPLGAIDHQQIAAFIDAAAERGITAVLLFPQLRTARDVARLLSELGAGKRWKLSRVHWPRGYAKPDSIALGLDWRTKNGGVCDAMGLAHVGTMPVTRRSPYVAIVVWGGAHLNPHIRAGHTVGVASAPTDLEKKAHSKLMKKTNERVESLLAIPPAEDPEWLRKVAFILPRAAAKRLLKQAVRKPS
jgi:hypothetical protein